MTLPMAVLGRTGLDVTRLGYGAAHHRPMSDDEARAVHEAVQESGINFIDTSDDYGNSEELIGTYLSHRRPDLLLATKCGMRPGGVGHLWTRENILRTLEQSLVRLRTDYVDVMQLHNATVEECERGGLVDGLEEMRRQGKVRWIGASTTMPHLPTLLGWGVFDAFQIPYSALEREHEEWITRSAEAGVGIIIRGGVARGEPGEGTGREDRWRKVRAGGAGRSARGGRDPLLAPLEIHADPPPLRHDNRRYDEPGPRRRERPDDTARAALARYLPGDQTPHGRSRRVPRAGLIDRGYDA